MFSLSIVFITSFLWSICQFIFNIWLSSCIKQLLVPFSDTWNIFMKKSYYNFWSLSIIQLSEFANNVDAILDSNCYSGPLAVLNPVRQGWLHMLRISLHRLYAMGILVLSFSVILATIPSSWIWSPMNYYFWPFKTCILSILTKT